MRLCGLQDMHVVDAGGRTLGRVFEFRSPGRAETEPLHDEREVRSLLCGHRGLLERLGWKQCAPMMVPWSDVVEAGPRRLRVRGRYDDYGKVDR